MHIKQLSDIEIKSLAYDAIANIEANQNNLKAFNAELANRSNKNMDNTATEPIEVVDNATASSTVEGGQTPTEEVNTAPEGSQDATEAQEEATA